MFRRRKQPINSASTGTPHDTHDVTDECTSADTLEASDAVCDFESNQADNQENPDTALMESEDTADSDGHPPTGSAVEEQESVHQSVSKNGINGYQKAIDNELLVLCAIGKFGWLTSLLISMYIWHNRKSRMGRLTLKRLFDKGQVIRRRLDNGQAAYVLSSSGTRRVNSETNMTVRSGKDIRFGEWQHRYLSNLYLIIMTVFKPEYVIYTEHEIVTGQVPFMGTNRMGRNAWMKKIPDGLIYVPDTQEVVWVEVENARKKRADMHNMIEFIRRSFYSPKIAHDANLRTVAFVLSEKKRPLMNTMAKSLREMVNGSGNSDVMGDSIRFIVLDVSIGLATRSLTNYPLWEVLEEIDA